MKHYRIVLECGCTATWWEADLFPGVGELAECDEHGTQYILSATEYRDSYCSLKVDKHE